MRRLILACVVLAIALACSDSNTPTPPPPVPTSQLHFVVQDTAGPPLYSDTVSGLFTAGQSADIRVYYTDTTSGGPGEEFLRFEVPGDGLLPASQPGDTVRISIKVVDATTFRFEFLPAGLKFNPNDPARLKVQYRHSDHDFDGDGQITAADSTIQSQLDIWKNDPPSSLWFKQGSVNFESFEELDSKIFSFSQYAVAW